MPLVKAQCENCSGMLTVDSSKKAAICPYCGTPYVVQDAINYYSTHIENLHADVVNIQNGESKQDLLKNAETFYRLGQFDRAKKAYEIVIERYPDEPQGWWGVYKATLHSFVDFHSLEGKYKQYASTAMKLYDYSYEYVQLWETLSTAYCKELHTNNEAPCIWDELSGKDIELLLYSSIDTTGNPYLKKIQAATFSNYYSSFVNGDVSFFRLADKTDDFWQGQEVRWPTYLAGHRSWSETCKLANIPVLQQIIDEGYHNAQNLFQSNTYRKLGFLKDSVQYVSKPSRNYCISSENNIWATCIDYSPKSQMQENAKSFDWDTGYKIIFILGKTIIVQYQKYDCDSHRNEPVYRILLTKEFLSPMEIKSLENKYWKTKGLCAHCGGNLIRGFFSTKCDRCGKKKDY